MKESWFDQLTFIGKLFVIVPAMALVVGLLYGVVHFGRPVVEPVVKKLLEPKPTPVASPTVFKPTPVSVATVVRPTQVSSVPTSIPVSTAVVPTPVPEPGVVEITIVCSPEYKDIIFGNTDKGIPSAVDEFNLAYEQGRNPVTGKPLAPGEMKIHITGKSDSSGTVTTKIANAINSPSSSDVERPTIFSPSVSHWLSIANDRTGRNLFQSEYTFATGEAPVVLTIWESQLKAIQAKYPGQQIGWEEILALMNDPQGWYSYGVTNLGRWALYYAHTDPMVSSTGLSTLIGEFFAIAKQVYGRDIPELTLEIVNDPRVQELVRELEKMVTHQWPRTTELKFAIAQGPEYNDLSPLELNDLIYINMFEQPPEKLVGLYVKEGTFIHEHPFAIPDAPWVSPEQREAAVVFTQFVLTEPIQRRLMAAGFMPVNSAVKLDYPFVSELGVDLNPPKKLKVPSPEVMSAIQRSWSNIKKQADVLLLVDTSGSMRGAKLEKAKEACLAFVKNQANTNRVGLMSFTTKGQTTEPNIQLISPITGLESERENLNRAINQLEAGGGTPLYDALMAAIRELGKSDPYRTRAIVLLSDGEDRDAVEWSTLNTVIETLRESKKTSRGRIFVVPIAYGENADLRTLWDIAIASNTRVFEEDPKTGFNIVKILETISKYF